jgi:hypothetical protein
MQCFCGCGTRVARRLRAINKRGAGLHKDVDRIQMLLDRGMESYNAQTFVEQATGWCEAFAAAVHSDTVPPAGQPGSQEIYARWKKEARPYLGQYGVAYFGAQIRKVARGRSDEELVLGMLSRGHWDPYVGASLPPEWETATGTGEPPWATE